MSQISKETKELNKAWVSKQQDLHKTYSSYIIGGGVLVVSSDTACNYVPLNLCCIG